jgi:hypothetical protein
MKGMRTLVMWGAVLVVFGCLSPEEKEVRRVEISMARAAQRRARSRLVETTATNLLPAEEVLVLRLTPDGVEFDDLSGGPFDGGMNPRPLDRFKAFGTAGWHELPLVVAAAEEIRERQWDPHLPVQHVSLDVSPDTPVFLVDRVVTLVGAHLGANQPRATLKTPRGLRSVWLETEASNSRAENCAHDEVPSAQWCAVPRVALGVSGATVRVVPGVAGCYFDGFESHDDHVWNAGPFLAADGGCVTRDPAATAALVREVIALAPGCSQVIIEVPLGTPWSTVAPVLAALADDDPHLRMVLSSPSRRAPDCSQATRPAGWQRFIQRAPRQRPDAGL